MTTETRKILTGMTLEQLKTLVAEMEEPVYRAEQLHHWLYIKSCQSFDEMTNVSKALKAKIASIADISQVSVAQRQIGEDGTIKFLIRFADNQLAETVLMRFDNRPNLTACVSTQVGCPINCMFCATGKRGFVRNLSAPEIVEQVLSIQRNTNLKVSNLVFMGQGEPLLNYDNLSQAIDLMNSSMEIGTRRMTVSTSGIIPGIKQLAQDYPQVTLAISLHAATSEIRKKLVPIEHKYPLDQLINALKEFNNITNRRITIEYVLLKGINDSLEDAKKLNHLLKDIHCNINLIPYNQIDTTDALCPPHDEHTKMFKYVLELSGKKVTVRLKRGEDIGAACGQLAGKFDHDEHAK